MSSTVDCSEYALRMKEFYIIDSIDKCRMMVARRRKKAEANKTKVPVNTN